ncbi:uncharacterized protein LOC102806499, partial [Saccoglossus kowalevskii]|uniref:E3 ubiquitin-protein ligase n=1 Tax=Saccoglossus kowalevskii TaxID=10224 RepID=A0ABM0MQV8_SACKO
MGPSVDSSSHIAVFAYEIQALVEDLLGQIAFLAGRIDQMQGEQVVSTAVAPCFGKPEEAHKQAIFTCKRCFLLGSPRSQPGLSIVWEAGGHMLVFNLVTTESVHFYLSNLLTHGGAIDLMSEKKELNLRVHSIQGRLMCETNKDSAFHFQPNMEDITLGTLYDDDTSSHWILHFVSLVQDLHATLESKDIDLTGKNIHPTLASRAMNDTNNKHKEVLIKETDAKFVYKVFGEQAKIKEAVDTFYSYLELLPPSGRHRRHKDSETGRRAYQRQSSKESLTDIRLQFTSKNGITVSVRHDNITKESVDIICNAANSQLKHAGGVANAIVKAGGQSIQKESFDIIRDKGRDLVMSEVVYTHAGKLDCQFVFHVVGPRWDPGRERQIRKDLYNCCMNLLTMADKDMKLHSIAIPAIGTGIYGVPKNVCAQQMAYAVEDFIRHYFQGHLRDIRFIDIDDKTVDIFTKAFEKFRGQPGTLGKISSVDQVEDEMHANSGTPVRSYASVTMDNVIHQSSSPATGTRPKSHPGTAARVDSTATVVDKTNRKDSNSNNDKQCSICLDDMNDPKTLRCKHRFCKKCIKQSEKHQGKTCPVCKDVYGLITGNMPKGSMVHKFSKIHLPGYEAFGSIVITYDIPSGYQG